MRLGCGKFFSQGNPSCARDGRMGGWFWSSPDLGGRSVGRYHLIRDTYHTMLKGVERGVRMTAGARPHQHSVTTLLLILFSSSSLFITRKQAGKQESPVRPSVYRYAFSLSSPPFTFAESRTERKEGKKKKKKSNSGHPRQKKREKAKRKTKKN